MEVAIIYESLTGTTEQAAFLVADELFRNDIASRVFNVKAVDAGYVADADLVVVGTWTDGIVIAGQRPAKKKKLVALPALEGKPTAVFCTYAVNPGKVLAKLERVVTDLGAISLGGMAFHRKRLDPPVRDFTERVLAAHRELNPVTSF